MIERERKRAGWRQRGNKGRERERARNMEEKW